MKQRYIVEVEIPEGSTKPEVGHYIKEAVESHSGGLHPNDPLFGISHARVRQYKDQQVSFSHRELVAIREKFSTGNDETSQSIFQKVVSKLQKGVRKNRHFRRGI